MTTLAPATGRAGRWLTDEPLRLRVPWQIHLLMVIATGITALVATWMYFGTVIAVVWGVAVVAAVVLWVRTTLRRPASRSVLPLYVLGIVVLLGHATEQWAQGYAQTLARLFPAAFAPPVHFSERASIVIFPFAATTLFLIGGAALFFHHPLGNFSAWLLFSLMIVLPVSHPVLALVAGQARYVPGMWSGPVVALIGVLGARYLARHRLPEEVR